MCRLLNTKVGDAVRIRSIKPEFWTSDDIADLCWDTRLIFIGIWSYVDDNGVGRDVPKLIVADLFPLEDDPRETLATVSRGLRTLHEAGLIERYSVEGRPYLSVTGWNKHQKIDRPSKPRYPIPTCGNAVPMDRLDEPSRQSRDSLDAGTGEQGNRGTGEQFEKTPSTPGVDDQLALGVASVSVTPSGATTTARPTLDQHFEEFWTTYPRKVGKQDARKVWDRSRKKTPIPDILAGSIRYRDDPNREDGFTAHPSTWLARGGWDDDPLPPRRNRTSQAKQEIEQDATDQMFDRAMTRAMARDQAEAVANGALNV